MSDPKRHHYVPKFYLDRFCRDDKLWVHDRNDGTYKHLPPKSVGAEKNFYAFTDNDGKWDVSAEKELSRIEGAAASVIRKLEAGQPISFKEKCDLALFVSLMRYRVPDFEKEHEEWHDTVLKDLHKRMFPTAETVKARMVQRGQEPSDEAARSIFEMLHNETYNVETKKPYYIAQMLELGMNTAQQLVNMRWLLAWAPQNTAFVTSDSPFLLVPPPDYDPDSSPYGVGIVTPGAQKCIPLTQRIYLCIQDEGYEVVNWQADRQVVQVINRDTAKSHRRFLFGRDEALLRKIAQTTTPLPRARPRINDSKVYKVQSDEDS